MSSREHAALLEPFDSFWEGPADIEKGYRSFGRFYEYNYLPRIPGEKDANILVISCGPGYFVKMLNSNGYRNVIGIDSSAEKVAQAIKRGLQCRRAAAFSFLEESDSLYDVIVCEQEINHLTKAEILELFKLCAERLHPRGRLIVHSVNGANPITGSEALAQNIDHFNTLTEYSLRQLLEHSGFRDITVFPLHLYVFWENPLNYLLWGISAVYSLFFRLSFMLYGKKNRIFTKKIGAVASKA